jgi:hypothetical protein
MTVPAPGTSWDVSPDSLARFGVALERPPTNAAWLRLRGAAEELALLLAVDRLITLSTNRIEELPH